MATERITLAVTPDELRLITILRDLPESPLRDRIRRLLDNLLTFARNPHCGEYQADGVPCADPRADCDQCQVVLDMLDRLERDWPAAQAKADR